MSERILDVTGVTKRFQTTVPKTVREILDVSNEDRIVWILDNGEIKVRKTRPRRFVETLGADEIIDFVRGMKPKDHVTLFYDTPENKRKILFNFLAAGFEKGEGALYICSEERPEQIRNEMEAFGIEVKKIEEEGALMIRNYDEWYIENGQAECDKIMAHLNETYEKFRKKGLKGLRGIGEAACFFKHNKVRELLRLEYAAHRVLQVPVEGICVYSIDTIVDTGYTEVIMPLVRAHGWAIFTGPGGSRVFKPENVEDSDVEKLLKIKI